jgi:hypothetical protein
MRTWTKGIGAGLLSGAVILGSLPALAEPYSPSIDGRQINQERRIYQGVQSGQVTPGEFRRLENQQVRIDAAETRMRADGRLNRQERTRLQRMENRSSRDIYRATHNRNNISNHHPGAYRPGGHRPAYQQSAHYRPGNHQQAHYRSGGHQQAPQRAAFSRPGSFNAANWRGARR